MNDIYKGMPEFMLLQVIGLIIVFVFPATVLWLPQRFTGKQGEIGAMRAPPGRPWK